MAVSKPPRPDLGGRPKNLVTLAKRAVRTHGVAWVAELESQAALGDAVAIRALLDLAAQQPSQLSRGGKMPGEGTPHA
jgi:hypothetical protein